MILFGEVVDHLGRGAYLTEIGHRGGPLRMRDKE